MNQLPMNPLTPEQQKRRMVQLYALMGEQVKGYHRRYHMGESSSVTQEVAQELMESLEYTLEKAGGMHIPGALEDILARGQEILEEGLERAKEMLRLVRATAPAWQTECRWEAMDSLGRYLEGYDFYYLAHRGPEEVFYPILIAHPEGIRGIDKALFYLQVLWAENQIMAAFSEEALEELWSRLPADSLNQCEQLLCNALGRALAGLDLETLVFLPEEYFRLLMALRRAGERELEKAGEALCRWMEAREGAVADYVRAALSMLAHWTGAIDPAALGNVFI